jgi:dolichol-phosphate mannosyltransferase
VPTQTDAPKPLSQAREKLPGFAGPHAPTPTLAVAEGDSGATPQGPIELSVIIPCYNERGNVAPMIARLEASLTGIVWEAVFVDDDSPDGTAGAVRAFAATDRRIRCIRRVGRRGLASAVIEGALSSSAAYVGVIDGDLQHDETRLPVMLAALRAGSADIVVASRFAQGGDAAGLSAEWRHKLSAVAIRMAGTMLRAQLTDPMSGFFMLRQPLFESIAPRLTGEGFKILLDLLLSAPAKLRITEVGATFRAREAGESKLSPLVMIQFAALLVDKALRGTVPLRFLSFAIVGSFGVLVHLAVLLSANAASASFGWAQTIATAVAMIANFQLNNIITYRDQRLRGGRLWRGLLLFILVCSVGAVANVGIARALYYAGSAGRTPAGAVGAVIGVVWNYAMSSTLVWGRRAWRQGQP